eukprot:scaffold804_cov165-Amphora_coffeaeformis.AAC.27
MDRETYCRRVRQIRSYQIQLLAVNTMVRRPQVVAPWSEEGSSLLVPFHRKMKMSQFGFRKYMF